jgi:hypothetical protein
MSKQFQNENLIFKIFFTDCSIYANIKPRKVSYFYETIVILSTFEVLLRL